MNSRLSNKFLLLIMLCAAFSIDASPVEEAISAVLKPLQGGLKGQVLGAMDAKVKQENYAFEGSRIVFEHQRWNVIKTSICKNHSENIEVYSQCTQAALNLFKLGCKQFQAKSTRSPNQTSEMRMYCNAVATYKPVVARISAPRTETANQTPKQLCNAATVRAMGRYDAELTRERNRLCGEYKGLNNK